MFQNLLKNPSKQSPHVVIKCLFFFLSRYIKQVNEKEAEEKRAARRQQAFIPPVESSKPKKGSKKNGRSLLIQLN